LVRLAGGLSLSGIVILSVVRAREVDSDVVSVLKTVDHAALGADQVLVVLRLDLDDVCSFILQLLAESKNVGLASVCLGLRALELDLAIVDLNVDIELLTKFSDVLTLLSDQNVGELLREVESESEATLKFVLLLLLDESEKAFNKCIGTVTGTTNRETLSRKVRLLTLDVSPDFVVELGRGINIARDDFLLSTQQTKKVLMGLLQGTLEVLSLVGSRLTSWQLVLVVEGVNLNRVETSRRVTTDEVHDVRAGLHGVLTITGVDLPSSRAVASGAGNDTSIVQALQILDSTSLLKILGDIASVSLGTKRSVGERARDVDASHGHAGCKLHNLVQTLVESVGRTNDGQVLVVLGIGRHDNSAASLGKEVVKRSASVTNNELMTTTLDGDLV
ncbi:hypothetical protein KCV03_g86, partial [Aureobasidium melanogenum]